MHTESIPKEQARRPSRSLHLLYHELRSSGSRYPYVTGVGAFEQQVELYTRLRATEGPGLWPELTFDDGHISNYEMAAPMLQSRGLTARFFITAGWTGTKLDYMGWQEVRSLHKAGNQIGAHGWTHTLLTHCNDRELQTELGRARLTLEDKLGSSITTMSLPGGRYNRRVLAACVEAGYTQIYTSEPKAESMPLGTTVGRLNIVGSMQPDWMERLFQYDSSVLSHLQRQYRMKEAAKRLLGDRLYERLWALVNRRESETAGGGDGTE